MFPQHTCYSQYTKTENLILQIFPWFQYSWKKLYVFLKRPVSSMQIHSHLPLELTLTLSHKYTTFQLNKKDGLERKSLLERKSEKSLPCFKFPLLSSAYESCTWYVSSNKSSQEPWLPVQSLGCFDLSYTSHLIAAQANNYVKVIWNTIFCRGPFISQEQYQRVPFFYCKT